MKTGVHGLHNAGMRAPKPIAIALAGMVSLAVAMGIGRFAFTPLLPLMQHAGTLTLAQGGRLARANYLGYLAGALLAMWLTPAPGRSARRGLVAVAALTAAMGLTRKMTKYAPPAAPSSASFHGS